MPFELREMDFGTIIDRGLKLFKDNFVPSVIIIAIFFGPFTFVIQYGMGLLQETVPQTGFMEQFSDLMQGKENEPPPDEDPLAMFEDEGSLTTLIVILTLSFFFAILTPIAYLSVFWFFSQHIIGLKPTIGEAIKHGAGKFWILIGARILCGLILAAIFFVFVIIAAILSISSPMAETAMIVITVVIILVAAIVISVYLLILPCVVAIEDSGARESLSRVFWLVKGYWWRTLGIYFLAALLVGVVTSIFQAVGAEIGALIPGTPGNVFTAAVSTLFTVIFQPITYAIIFLIYLDLRIRKEGFDLNILTERAYGNASDSDIPLEGKNDWGN